MSMTNASALDSENQSGTLELPVSADEVKRVYPPTPLPAGHEPHIRDLAQYQQLYRDSIEDPHSFWGDVRHLQKSEHTS